MDITKELTHISLCAGYGGIDIGLKRVLPNLRTVAFSEIEAYAVANLVAKMEAGLLDAAPVWTNLKTFPWRKFRGKVDILSGGFPCQPFSAAGRRKGDEDPRHLFPYIKQGIQLLRPAIVFLENVEGIISSKLGEGWTDTEGTPVLLHVLRELERVDYKATAGIFSASEIGAPHQRKRVFIMAYSNNNKHTTGSIDFIHQIGRSMEGTRSPISKEWSTRSDAFISNCDVLSFNRRDEFGELSKRINSDVFPSRRGEDQKEYEPKRTLMGDSQCLARKNKHIKRGCNFKEDSRQKTTLSLNSNLPEWKQRKTESSLGGDVDGGPDWMDYGDLCESICNRTDELRLLGNGVVPATAERAFRVLWEELNSFT